MREIIARTEELIDGLKAVCAQYGLGNDGNEYKIITQVFLFKFLNDKFGYEIRRLDPSLAQAGDWGKAIADLPNGKYEILLKRLGTKAAKFTREQSITSLFHRQYDANFADLFDNTLQDIATQNNDIFSVRTDGGARVTLFDRLSHYIADPARRDDFCRALVNKLLIFSFEDAFGEKYDFFATIFEYLIKDYNKDSGGKYAEYYTPHAVARIIAAIMEPDGDKDVSCYDPAAGSGTLLMSLAHAIGEDNCTIYSQDISQKSSGMLRLNLILNNLVHSIPNIIQGDTLLHPFHKEKDGKTLRHFDRIVSNPPFKVDFSDTRDALDQKENKERFFAGIPTVPKKQADKMPIYLLFIQHVMSSLAKGGRAAIVVPTGFLTAKGRIEEGIRKRIVEQNMLKGVVSMPSNIFATTGTNVSVLFLDKDNCEKTAVLLDASKLGAKIKEGKNQRTILSHEEEVKIIGTFNGRKSEDDFSVVVSLEDIKSKKYSFSAGQYFDVKIEYEEITPKEFQAKIKMLHSHLIEYSRAAAAIDMEIKKRLGKLSCG